MGCLDTANETIHSARAGSGRSAQRAAERLVIACVAGAGSRPVIRQAFRQGIDWAYLQELADFHGVGPLVAGRLREAGLAEGLPEAVCRRIGNARGNALFRNLLLGEELGCILAALKGCGIEAMPLKGTVLAEELYGHIGLRHITDIDLLVRPEDLPRARATLGDLAYEAMSPREGQPEHPFHGAPYCKQGRVPLVVELHWDLDDPRLSTAPQQTLWNRARRTAVHGVTARTLSPEDNLLFLCNHLSRQGDGLLRCLGDIAALLQKHGGNLDWEYVVRAAHEWGVATAACVALSRAAALLGAPVPGAVLARLGPGTWRRRLLGVLVDRHYFVSPRGSRKLRDETMALADALARQRLGQTLIVLSKHRGEWKRLAWLRTGLWVPLVLLAALSRRMATAARRG